MIGQLNEYSLLVMRIVYVWMIGQLTEPSLLVMSCLDDWTAV